MRILALDTTTETGSCALWTGGAVLERHCPAGQPHSETLLPLIQALLAEAGMGFAQLDGIGFGCGPGAFTGLRIACALTQGLAVVHDTPVLPVTSLECLAAQSGRPKALAVLDARMNEVYVGAFHCPDGERPIAHGPLQVVAPDQVPMPATPGWTVIGNALNAYPVLAARAQAAGCDLQAGGVPLAGTVARLAALALAAGGGLDAAEATPRYIRDKVAKTVAERLEQGGRA